MEFDHTGQEWSLGGPLPLIVQMVLIGCISRSWGQKIGFQNAIFKKSSRLKLHGPELSYLVYIII